MIEHAESIWSSIDRYLMSKVNAAVSLSTSTALVVSAEVKHQQAVFDYVFLFQVIGSIYVSLQIIHMLYKFYKWLRSF
jgi:hypothetical protein